MSTGSLRSIVACGLVLLLVLPAWGAQSNGNPLAAPQPFAGTFRNDKLTVKLEYDATLPVPSYKGEIELGPATFPARGTVKDGKLEGSFVDKDGNSFAFVAALEGDTLTLTSGGTTYKLSAQRPAVNPLAQPQNPLAQTPAPIRPTPVKPDAEPPVAVPPAGNQPGNAGVGMHITLTGEGAIVVDELVDKGPAARGGVRVGDRLIAVDDRPLRNVQDLGTMLPGAPGSTMKLKVQRGNQPLEFNLIREVTQRPGNAPGGNPPGPGAQAPAAPPKGQEVQLVQYSIQDPALNLPALAFVAPADWTRQGEVAWTGHIAPAAITLLRIANPKGPEELLLYPTVSFTTGNPQQALGAPNHPYLDVAGSIRQIIIPRCRPEARNGKELGFQEMPKIAEEYNKQALAQKIRIPQIQAGRLLVEYTLDDRPMLEMFYCVTTAINTPNGTLWSIDKAFSYRSSKDKFYGEAPLFNWMAVCLRENPQWTAARLQRVRDMVNRAFPVKPATPSNSGLSILDVSRSMARDQDRFLSHIDKLNTSRLNSTDTWTAAFRNTSTLTDPTTGEQLYNMPNTYQRTFRTDSGVIYGTDDPTYDPWVNSHIRATELK
ncbi:MAG: PDZ domain-containing protein [Tepidisphaerales bacterium]